MLIQTGYTKGYYVQIGTIKPIWCANKKVADEQVKAALKAGFQSTEVKIEKRH